MATDLMKTTAEGAPLPVLPPERQLEKQREVSKGGEGLCQRADHL